LCYNVAHSLCLRERCFSRFGKKCGPKLQPVNPRPRVAATPPLGPVRRRSRMGTTPSTQPGSARFSKTQPVAASSPCGLSRAA